MGLPKFEQATLFVMKYWINFGALRLLVLGQLAIVPLLWRKSWAARLSFVLGVLVVLAFLVSRMSIDVFGAKLTTARVHHSIPRYWTPVYLFAALPPLLYLGRTREPLILFVGSLLAVLVCARSLWDVSVHEGTSLRALARSRDKDALWVDTVTHEIRSDAIVFTKTRDKLLWSHYQLGMLSGDMELVAASMDRAMNAHLNVFMVEPRFSSFDYRKLAKALKKRNLTFIKLDSYRGVYRVKPAPEPVAESAQN